MVIATEISTPEPSAQLISSLPAVATQAPDLPLPAVAQEPIVFPTIPAGVTMLEAALTYAAAGFPVFPCYPVNKRPLCDNGFKDATCDDVQIIAWWTEHPKAAVGFVPWSKGLVALDFDVDKKNGERLANGVDLEARTGLELPQTRTHGTPSTGQHLFYQSPEPYSNSDSLLPPLVNIRCAGGYVLLPPSIAIDDNGACIGAYTVIDASPIAPLPDSIVKLLRKKPAPLPAPTGPIDHTRGMKQAREYLQRLIDKGDVAFERDNTGQSRTFNLAAALTHDYGLSAEEACELILEPGGWGAHCKPAWDGSNRDELLEICKRGAKYGQNPEGSRIIPPASEAFADTVANLPAVIVNTALDGIVQPCFRDRSDRGKPHQTLDNARAALRCLPLDLRYNSFREMAEIRMKEGFKPIQQYQGEVSDNICLQLRVICKECFDFEPSRNYTDEALQSLCLENRYDPVCDYLVSLTWDGVERLDRWMVKYLAAEDTEFVRAVGRLSLIAAVRRARQPGCKFDQIIVLESGEGKNKSTAIRTLAEAVGKEYFSDESLLGADDKRRKELIRGIWLYECADLAGLRKAEVEGVKAFASRQVDRGRDAYERRSSDQPRRCVLFATTNNDTYLQSQTGNRRFWPVTVGRIDLEALKSDRDQLWAEAAFYEAQGVSITLPEELWPVAREEQAKRLECDPLLDMLADVVGGSISHDGGKTWQEEISTSGLMKFLNVSADRTASIGKKIKPFMEKLSWEYRPKLQVEGRRGGGYVRPCDPPQTPIA